MVRMLDRLLTMASGSRLTAGDRTFLERLEVPRIPPQHPLELRVSTRTVYRLIAEKLKLLRALDPRTPDDEMARP